MARLATLLDTDPAAALVALAAVAREAGGRAMEWFRPGARTTAHIAYKDGGSPVTDADLAVDAFLARELAALFPEAGWLSEETADSRERLSRRLTLVVDPIDGTRGFAEGDARWAVSVALVRDGAPVLAVVEAPALQETYTAIAGGGAFLNGVRLEAAPARSRAIAGPRPLAGPLAHALGLELTAKTPSLAVRFAHVAADRFAAAVASPNAHDWDIAAADLLLRETGRRQSGLDGRPIVYNRPDIRHGALYAAGAEMHDRLLAHARAPS